MSSVETRLYYIPYIPFSNRMQFAVFEMEVTSASVDDASLSSPSPLNERQFIAKRFNGNGR